MSVTAVKLRNISWGVLPERRFETRVSTALLRSIKAGARTGLSRLDRMHSLSCDPH
jgi:hypothetical protein